MAAASGTGSPPPGVTLDVINEAKGRNQLQEIAKKFNPPVSTETCKTLPEQRERLRCAFRKSCGSISSDLEYVS